MKPHKGLEPPVGWVAVSSARLQVPPMASAGWLFRGLSSLARCFGRADIPDVFKLLNIQRRLFLPWLWFASKLMPFGSLPARERELLILRTGWNARCRYEWGQHVDLALRAGLSDADIVGAAQGPQAFADEGVRHLIQACDELCQKDTVSEGTWQALRGRWHEPQLVEVLMLVGHYRMLAGFLNSSGARLEAPIEARLQAFEARALPR